VATATGSAPAGARDSGGADGLGTTAPTPAVPDARLAAAFAVGGALLVGASLPPMGFWPLALPGLALIDHAVAGCAPWSRFCRGWLAGVALLAPTSWWMHDLTLPGWLLASVLLSALLGAVLAASPPTVGRWLALPGAWLLFEAIKGRWPFGGVPLSTLGVGQVTGPLAGVARVGGSLLLGGVTVAAAVALAAAARRSWTWAGAAAAVVAVAVVLSAVAPDGDPTGRFIDVAAVQGGGPQGTRAIDTDEREVFERHLAASELVETPVDLVVWPEDVVDVEGPVADAREGAELAALADRLDTVLVAGVIEGADEHFRNAAIAFGPDGQVIDAVEKERRVPFGEWVPFRGLIEPFAPDALPRRDASVGHGDPVLDLPAPIGPAGVVISWEVFFPDRARDAIGHGGEILLNPTNGASFSGTQVQAQQVASSQLRAIETGRWVVQAAPTGFSAIVTPGGDVVDRTAVSEPAVVHGTIEARTGRTWALNVGDWLPVGLALAAMAAGWWVELRRRRAADAPDELGAAPSQ
jgi:apolipoprotein N-acyltransferase